MGEMVLGPGDWRVQMNLTGRWAKSLSSWPTCAVARSDEQAGKLVEMS